MSNSYKWDNEGIEMFIDDNDTKFIRGPFEFEENGTTAVYDYKLIDPNGEDYCTVDQMKAWGVQMRKVLK